MNKEQKLQYIRELGKAEDKLSLVLDELTMFRRFGEYYFTLASITRLQRVITLLKQVPDPEDAEEKTELEPEEILEEVES